MCCDSGAAAAELLAEEPSDLDTSGLRDMKGRFDARKQNQYRSVMAANTRMATAVQILCVIAYRGERGANAEIVARSLGTNPVVVRRMLKSMEHQGLVEIRPGKDGGVQLALEPSEITLERIYKAVEGEPAVFALRPQGNPNCPVDTRMKGLLTPIFGAAETAVEQTLRQTTLDNLVKEIA